MKIRNPILVLIVLVLLSCAGGKKDNPVFYDSGDIESDSIAYEDSVSGSTQVESNGGKIAIPFEERGGVKYVEVSVNGFGFEMIFDTGCSGTLISVAEANYLYQKGYLTTEDYLGNSNSQIADGSIVENMVFNIREVIIGDKIRCTNVTATVSANNNAPLLLGNEVLNRVASYTIDNEHQTINFKLR